MRKLDKAKRGIILLHDTRASTARMVPALLRALKAGGYRIVQIVPGPGPADTTPAPKGWTSETDRIIAEVFGREAAHRTERRERRFAFQHRRRRFEEKPVAWSSGPIRAAMMRQKPRTATRYAYRRVWRGRSDF